MDKNFGGVIWTNHALSRMHERGISQGDAWATFRRPGKSRFAKNRGAWIYYKIYGKERLEVVAKQNKRKEWIILSVWSSPIYDSTEKKKESFWKFLLRRLKKRRKH